MRLSEHLAGGSRFAVVLRKPDDGGGAAPPDPAPTGAEGGAPLPWQEPSAQWAVNDKPWYEHLPEGPTRELMKAKNYANPQVLADSYYSLNQTFQQRSGDNVVQLPGEDADEKTLNEFYSKLGRPETPDKYDLGLGDTDQADPRFVEFGKSIAHKLGLNNKQAQTLAKGWNEFVSTYNAEAQQQVAQRNDQQLADLKASLGDDFNTFGAAGARVLDALKANKVNGLAMTDEDFAAIESNIGAAPLAKLLAAVGQLAGEASFVTGAPGGGQPGTPEALSPEAAAQEIQRLNADADFQKRYTDATHAGHKEALDRMNRLYARAGNSLTL